MADDGGKYDDVCTAVREATNGQGVVVVVINGTRGSGFSVQAVDSLFPALVLSGILEDVARQIRASVAPGSS